MVVNWPHTIACVTTYNRFLHLIIGANDEARQGEGKVKGGLVFQHGFKFTFTFERVGSIVAVETYFGREIYFSLKLKSDGFPTSSL